VLKCQWHWRMLLLLCVHFAMNPPPWLYRPYQSAYSINRGCTRSCYLKINPSGLAPSVRLRALFVAWLERRSASKQTSKGMIALWKTTDHGLCAYSVSPVLAKGAHCKSCIEPYRTTARMRQP
jgi:hypothetical protein